MQKPKFKLSKEELLDFNDACIDAVSHCPNHNKQWWLEDRDILLGRYKTKDVLRHWLSCDILWDKGYSEELSLYALEVVSEYKKYKILKKAYHIEMEGCNNV